MFSSNLNKSSDYNDNRLEALRVLFAIGYLQNRRSQLLDVGLPNILLDEDTKTFDVVPSTMKAPVTPASIQVALPLLTDLFLQNDIAEKIRQSSESTPDLSNPTRYAIANALVRASLPFGGIEKTTSPESYAYIFNKYELPQALFNNKNLLAQALDEQFKQLDQRLRNKTTITQRP